MKCVKCGEKIKGKAWIRLFSLSLDKVYDEKCYKKIKEEEEKK